MPPIQQHPSQVLQGVHVPRYVPRCHQRGCVGPVGSGSNSVDDAVGESPAQSRSMMRLSIHKRREMQKIEIHIKGCISEKWSEWLGGLSISHSDPDETVLTGVVVDQAALYGIISRLRDLGLQLTSVSSEEIEENSHEHNQ